MRQGAKKKKYAKKREAYNINVNEENIHSIQLYARVDTTVAAMVIGGRVYTLVVVVGKISNLTP